MLAILAATFLACTPDVLHTRGGPLRVHYEVDETRSVPAGAAALVARRPGEDWREVARVPVGDPLRISLREEGVWHLAAVAVGVDGSREDPGEDAEAVVIVDTTPPEIETETHLAGDGEGLVLRFRARDRHLAAEGVGVRLRLGPAVAAYRAGKDGRVGLGAPPEGRRWTVRLDASDRAGNRTEIVLRLPEAAPDPIATGEGAARPPASYARGRSLLSRGEWREAAEELRRVVEGSPRDGRAWNDLGVALARLGRRTEAAAAFGRALAADPEHAAAGRNLAIVGTSRRDAPVRLASRRR